MKPIINFRFFKGYENSSILETFTNDMILLNPISKEIIYKSGNNVYKAGKITELDEQYIYDLNSKIKLYGYTYSLKYLDSVADNVCLYNKNELEYMIKTYEYSLWKKGEYKI